MTDLTPTGTNRQANTQVRITRVTRRGTASREPPDEDEVKPSILDDEEEGGERAPQERNESDSEQESDCEVAAAPPRREREASGDMDKFATIMERMLAAQSAQCAAQQAAQSHQIEDANTKQRL